MTSPSDKINGQQYDDIWKVQGLEIASWSSGPDGAGVPPTQVHVLIDTPQFGVQVIRLKSREITDWLIAALTEHRDFVWPEK